jgi:hypothetical protein
VASLNEGVEQDLHARFGAELIQRQLNRLSIERNKNAAVGGSAASFCAFR